MKILKNKILKKYTTFRIGGKADFFAEPESIDEIIKAVQFAKEKKIPFVVMGNGSNILVNDKGYRGLVIKMKNEKLKIKNDLMVCEAGVPLSRIINEALKHKLSGTEFLAGIPGTLGGAIVGNAGTSNKRISDILESVKLLKSNGKIIETKKDYFKFGYRESKIKKNGDIILEAILKLKKNDKKIIQKNITKIIKKREKQPYGYSAGSVFKNPEKYKAAELIEKAGLKDRKKGDAQISKEHANFIINLEKATSSDVKYLINEVRKEVLNKFSVQLEREIRYLNKRGWR